MKSYFWFYYILMTTSNKNCSKKKLLKKKKKQGVYPLWYVFYPGFLFSLQLSGNKQFSV